MSQLALQEPELWFVEEVAAYLRVPKSAIYKMTGKKAKMKIPHLRLSGRLRFRKMAVDEWLRLLEVSNSKILARIRRASGINS